MDTGEFPAGLRVLAVDDDCVSLMILERQLKHCNYNVTAVTDAKKALDMLREKKDEDQFQLVISDVVMPDIDGFKLLELIGLEMDIPVIMLSANNETETMMKGINHGACDYLVKPVRFEQLRGIWIHVLRNSKSDPRNNTSGNDNAGQKLQSGDGGKGEKNCANRTRKDSKKNKKVMDGADENKENTSTQKRQRVKWTGELHRKFVKAVDLIGINRAAPKNILEVMNVDGLTRENVASHLQKYRTCLKKLKDGELKDGELKNTNPFIDEPKSWWRGWVPANSNTDVPGSSKHHPELGRYKSTPSFFGSPSSSNLFARMNSPSAFGTHSFLPTQSVEHMSSQRNLGIPRQDMEPVGHGINLAKGAVPVLVQDVSRFTSSGNSYEPILSGGLSGASFPSGPSGRSIANISNGVVFNTSKPLSLGISGSSYANIADDSLPLASMPFPSPCSCRGGKILGASRGVPFEDIADGEVLAPSGNLPLHPPELVNQPSVQIQSSSAGLFNQVATEADQSAGPNNSSNSQKADVPSRFPDLGHNLGVSRGPSQGNTININQLSRLAASSGHIPTFGNVYQNQITEIMEKIAPMVGLCDQVAPFNFGSNTQYTAMPIGNSDKGSSSSTRPTLPNLQIDDSVMPIQMLNGGGASGNLPEGGSIDQQAVGDEVINSNESLVGTTGAQNGASGDLDEFFANLVNEQDFINNGDAFFGGYLEFSP
ncbi:Two-component response regulator ORR25 [Dichanthelium oligosanthes]|uniref:Two-component response regulator ORR25 n=1 Tax=Dichanthelium oligosanthes TaxID=888268 RepID=A0A1E5W0M2_9POAL|nr:Two-component response regulator ORR25 [Dichanthelium oligosanthes]